MEISCWAGSVNDISIGYRGILLEEDHRGEERDIIEHCGELLWAESNCASVRAVLWAEGTVIPL